MNAFATTVLILAILSTGLFAGAFQLYGYAIMPGLRRADDRTFVGAFRAIDRAIVNPWFLLAIFVGAPLLTLVAGILALGTDRVGWIAAALVLNLVTIVITAVVHLPRNNALKAAGDLDRIDVSAARRTFRERRWSGWNLVRSVTSMAAFALLTVALAM